MAKFRAESKPLPATKRDKKKKKRSANGPKSLLMKSSAREKTNPFDTIWSRTKFSVVGRRRKGEERRIGQSRALSIQKRDRTLRKEYEERAKSSKFIDKRIGEEDDTLPDYDKAILRLQRVHMAKLKKARKYNLSDVDDIGLSTFNNSLSERDDFEDNESIEEDGDDGGDDGARVSSSQFELQTGDKLSRDGGLVDEKENENSSKTNRQAFQDIISKSKYYKAQKAKDKEEDEHLMGKLDKDFASLSQNEAFISLTVPSNVGALKALVKKDGGSLKAPANKDFSGQSTKDKNIIEKDSSMQEKPDSYDKLVKEMALDMRARPSDRTKTPEEIAQEERERLEELEEERKKRMFATADSDDEYSDDDEDIEASISKKSRPLSGDELGDSFSINEEKENKKGWIDDIEREANLREEVTSSEDYESENDDQENSENDASCSDRDESASQLTVMTSVKDWEQSDDDGNNDDSDLNLEAQGSKEKERCVDEQKIVRSSKEISLEVNKAGIQAKEVLPFVLEAPNNLAELCSLLDNRPDTEVVEAIKRIRVCNSVKLSAENRRKMQVFYGVLLQYFAVVSTRRPLNMKVLNSLVKPLVEMSGETPYFASICARERLIRIRTKFCEDIKITDQSCWPSLKTLSLLRLWSLIFPCSDFRHVVMTPATLLMCEYLMRCPVVCCKDIAVGTFLCFMVLSVAKLSRKFYPEAVVFLQSLLLSTLSSKPGSLELSPVYDLMILKDIKPMMLHISSCVDDLQPIDFITVMDKEADSPFFRTDYFKAGVLNSAIETLKEFVKLYEGLSSFSEIFSPFRGLIHEVSQNPNIPDSLLVKLRETGELIKKKNVEQERIRQPLQMRRAKPEPIKLLNPKFEENFVKGRDYDPDSERVERKKLKKLLKSERKGAVRELRKDNHYLFELKEKEWRKQEEEKAEEYGKLRAFLQEQEHAFKSGQLGKGRKRRR